MKPMSYHARTLAAVGVLLAGAGTSVAAATQYTYDDLNRLTKVQYDNGSSISYGYDAAGNLLTTTKTSTSVKGKVNPDNGHGYELVECGSWTQCRDRALSLGGRLVTIRSAAESSWIIQNMLPLARTQWGVWIGATATAGVWGWTSKEAMTYTNWGTGEPNAPAADIYTHIYGLNAPVPAGQWNNTDNLARSIGVTQGVVEYTADLPTLHALWNFDDCTANDSSGNGNHGVLHGTQCVPGTKGSALRFVNSTNSEYDDKKDWVQLPSFSAPGVSFHAKVKWEQASQTLGIVHEGAIWSLGDNNSDHFLALLVRPNSGEIHIYGSTSYVSIADGQWKTIALTSDGTSAQLYVNGVLRDSVSFVLPKRFLAMPQYLAYHQWSDGAQGSSRFFGSIDEARVYSRQLTAQEVLDIHLSENFPR